MSESTPETQNPETEETKERPVTIKKGYRRRIRPHLKPKKERVNSDLPDKNLKVYEKIKPSASRKVQRAIKEDQDFNHEEVVKRRRKISKREKEEQEKNEEIQNEIKKIKKLTFDYSNDDYKIIEKVRKEVKDRKIGNIKKINSPDYQNKRRAPTVPIYLKISPELYKCMYTEGQKYGISVQELMKILFLKRYGLKKEEDKVKLGNLKNELFNENIHNQGIDE